ncbi:tryptophanase [Kribbella sp. NBC_01245]|uniref:tryptophanase n=1 Tax=Kribbella sp. NBC_01245 TaxID=2903578 RepID=UPI002E2BD0F9|nr:tryptophanase [Kribbella sp. NBC_01245]
MTAFMEPFRIKSVEPIAFPTAAERRAALEAAGYNLFKVDAAQITIDLLTDSGTGAMSAAQWSALLSGDESYAGARSFRRFESVVQELTGFSEVLPVHQGRAAERLVLSTLLKPGQASVSNTHFDTTRAHVELAGGKAVDIPAPDGGDIDLDQLRKAFAVEDVACVVLTVTNNGLGGKPVLMQNIRDTRAICDEFDVPLILDAARFAENAYLITEREPEFAGRLPREVAEEMFRLADIIWASLKKDGIANIGGLIAMNDQDLAARCRLELIAYEGFPTYGGLAGRDLEALAQGLLEVTEPSYLRYRAESARWFGEALRAVGMPVIEPVGLHAVYIDAGELLPGRTLPANALLAEFYLEGGIRASELGTLAFGRIDPAGGPDIPSARELVRFCLPRRVYTQSHLEYVVETAAAIAKRAESIPSYRITHQSPVMRHFTATLAPV